MVDMKVFAVAVFSSRVLAILCSFLYYRTSIQGYPNIRNRYKVLIFEHDDESEDDKAVVGVAVGEIRASVEWLFSQ